MDGIRVQDNDWNAKLSASLADLLDKKLLCDFGIVCGVTQDVPNLKTNEVVMVHRCILAGASEIIRKLSLSDQVYSFVKIDGLEISHECWNNVLEFVYKGKTDVLKKHLCDVKNVAKFLQIKTLEKAVELHHSSLKFCICNKSKTVQNSLSFNRLNDNTTVSISDPSWLNTLFEGMLDLLVKQSLCNMTIITEKQDKVSAEILAHLCMLVASSSTIKELVLQGNETYHSVKIDSIAHNTWLYLLEYIYTGHVTIVKSNIPEVWTASQLLKIDGLANAVEPYASQMAAVGSDNPSHTFQKIPNVEIPDHHSEKSVESLHSDLSLSKKETMLSNMEHDINSFIGPTSPGQETGGKKDNDVTIDQNLTASSGLLTMTDLVDRNDPSDMSINTNNGMLPTVDESGMLSMATTSSSQSPNSLLLSDPMQSASIPLLNVNINVPASALNMQLGQQFVVPTSSLMATTGLTPSVLPNDLTSQGQLINTIQPDGTTAMIWVPNSLLPILTSNLIQTPEVKPTNVILSPTKVDGVALIKENQVTNGDQSQNSESFEFVQCESCNQIFEEKSLLEKHQCPKGFDKNDLQGLIMDGVQRDVNKLMCQFCKKVFSRTWTLNVHLRTHTGERPYKCKHCNKAFSDKSNMRQHSLIHTSKKEYNCPKCNQAFAQKRYMKKHFMETCRRKFGTEAESRVDNGKTMGTISQMRFKGQITSKHVQNNVLKCHLIGSNNIAAQIIQIDPAAEGSSHDPELNTYKSNVSEPGDIKCDIDLGKQLVSKTEIADTSNSGSAWDTSIMMGRGHSDSGDDIDEAIMDNDSSSDLGELVLEKSEKVNDEEPINHQPEDIEHDPEFEKLYCKGCKKRFKNERQRNCHRCMEY